MLGLSLCALGCSRALPAVRNLCQQLDFRFSIALLPVLPLLLLLPPLLLESPLLLLLPLHGLSLPLPLPLGLGASVHQHHNSRVACMQGGMLA